MWGENPKSRVKIPKTEENPEYGVKILKTG